MRLRAESDSLSITKLSSDNSRVREDLANKESNIDRLRKELESLRGDADFKTLQVSKLTSELNAKGDLGATL
jgi:predicted nuclease with TOPRIM domain